MNRLLRPKSIAVVGLSADPKKHGRRVLANLQKVGYDGTVYGVHPSGPAVGDVEVVASLDELPEPPDVVVSAVPAAAVPGVARAAAAKGAGALIVFAGGFSEADSAGAALQQELQAGISGSGMRVLGPNSGGVIVASSGVALSFLTCLDRSASEIRSGAVGLVTQSGGTGSYIHNLAAAHGGGLAASISTGNEVDFDVADGINGLAEMDEVRAIGVVLETVRNGQRFIDAVVGAHDLGKRVVAVRIGTSDVGRRLMRSHTGALAGPDRVLEGVLDSLGVPVAATPAEMLEIAEVLARTPQPLGSRVGVVTHSGGMAILLADLAEATPIELPAPSEALGAAMAPLLQQGSLANPVDLGGIIGGPQRFGEAVDAFARSGEFDMVMAVSSAHPRAHSVERARSLIGLTTPVPVVHLWMAGDVGADGLDLLRAKGAVVTDEPRAAIGALAALAKHPARTSKSSHENSHDPTISPGGRFTEDQAKDVLRSWDIPVVDGAVADSPSAAVAIAERLGYPVVVKVSGANVMHKTEVGGVALGLANDAEVRASYEIVVASARTHAPHARFDGVLVERMATGVEMIVGVVSDATFGPMLLVGLGGVAAEAFDDVRIAPAPTSAAHVAGMVESLRGRALLTAPRHGDPADLRAFAELASHFSERVACEVALKSFELNPVCWTGTTWVALDAAIETHDARPSR